MAISKDELERRRRFERLVIPLQGDLLRYAYWLNGQGGTAEDVVQEALLRAWKSFERLQDDGAVKHWLLTIVRRENARQFERKRLETVDVDDLAPQDQAWLSNSHDTDFDDLRAGIFALDPDYREPLVLQVLVGLSTEEIAGIMGIKRGAVLTRLHRARHRLKDKLEDFSEADDPT
jgi:RNA polymerase sigma-70 factor (ECF subfamily)